MYDFLSNEFEKEKETFTIVYSRSRQNFEFWSVYFGVVCQS